MAAEFTVEKPQSIFRAFLYFMARDPKKKDEPHNVKFSDRSHYLVIKKVMFKFNKLLKIRYHCFSEPKLQYRTIFLGEWLSAKNDLFDLLRHSHLLGLGL